MMPCQVYTLLFDRIVRDEFAAGTWLREDALAEGFGVSRTPVREALRQLAQDGLVETVPRRGSRSLGFTIDDLEETYAIRCNLELLALERSLPTINLNELMALRSNMEALSATEDPHKHAELDGKLHRLIVDSSGGKRLSMMLTSLYRIMATFRELGFANAEVREQALEEHLALIDALVSRDAAAATILGNHIRSSKSRILAIVIRGPVTQATAGEGAEK